MSKTLTSEETSSRTTVVTQRRTRGRLPVIAGIVLVVLGLVFGGLAARMVAMKTTSIPEATVSLFVPSPASVFGKDRIYLMLLGIDFNYDEKGMPYSKGARSDTIMAAGIDFPTRTVHMVSVLRDTEAMVNGRDSKINEAYSDGGVKLADRVIGDFLGMPADEHGRHFDRFVVVNSNGVKDFVNAIGGLDVPVDENMDYDDNWGQLHIHLKRGLQHLNGEQVKGYMRFRHDACSDPCRTKRQQQVIHLLIGKLEHDKINTISHIGPLLAVINKNIYTNLSSEEERSLAWSFKDANPAKLLHADTIGYVDTKDTAYAGQVLVPDEKQKAKLVAELLGPYAVPTPAPVSAIEAVKPHGVHLVVENGSGVPGLAATAAQKLRAAGYTIDSVSNADRFGYTTSELHVASRIPLVGERVRRDLGLDAAVVANATDATPGPLPLVTVIVGKDFAAAHPPAAAATPSAAP